MEDHGSCCLDPLLLVTFVSQFYSGLVSLDITAEVNSVNNSTASLYHLIDLLKL